MQILLFFILGLIQGLCEFLPISSSGHLVLFSQIFNIEDSLFVSIILHVATLLAVCFVFKKEVLNLIIHPFSKESMTLVVATIPTCVIVLILMPLINLSFGGSFLAISFIISSIMLFFVQKLAKKTNERISYKHAFIMGIAQGFAVFPGISRSGTTISAGLMSGGDKMECAKFSFLMSVPIIILSLILEIVKIFIYGEIISINISSIVCAFITAFITGILSIKLMIKMTSKLDFKWFSFYLFFIAIVTLIIL